ncbi:hypothetical protein [Propioniciclava sp.]|uniref:hypothetical protein n=1 Tax=Propioniciclava sp. TaxID=2038686 RepID=UPI002601A97A|nr:hypothetical protein [Propioniciclava sp.]
MSTLSRRDRLPDPHAWVEAAPFAAHLARLAASTGFPVAWIAVHVGLPVTLAARLLGEDDGRPVRRLPRHFAARLLALDAEALGLAARVSVPAARTAQHLAELRGRGGDLRALAAQLGTTPSLLDAAADGEIHFVPQPWLWAAVAASALWDARVLAAVRAA